MTQIPCDLPYFIKSGQHGFQKTYKEFLTKRTNSSKFLISANPSTFQDVMLTPQKISYFFENTVARSNNYFEIYPLFMSTRRSDKGRKLNSFLSPLLFTYNNISLNLPIVISGYPYLQLIDYMARKIKPKDLSYLCETGKRDGNIRDTFDAFINKNKSTLHDVAIQYNYEMIYQASQYYNNIIAFVKSNDIEDISALFYKERTGKEPTITEMIKPKSGNHRNLSFTNYLKNLIALDAVYDKYLFDYFWANKVFPYLIDPTMHGSNYATTFTQTLVNHFNENLGRPIIDMEKDLDEVESLEKLFKDKLDD